jgi:DinB superfamily
MVEAMARTLADVATDLAALVRESVPRLEAIGEAGSQARGPGTWVRKEILGHLIDSCLNNHQRFVRAQLGERLDFPDYAGDAWVAAEGFRDRPWPVLVALWAQLNEHLAHVIGRIPAERLDTPCRIGNSSDHALELIVRDYVVHLRHHLGQILDPAAAAGRTHPPFA